MIRNDWIDKPDQQVFVVKPLKETAECVSLMPDGVSGGASGSPLLDCEAAGLIPRRFAALKLVKSFERLDTQLLAAG